MPELNEILCQGRGKGAPGEKPLHAEVRINKQFYLYLISSLLNRSWETLISGDFSHNSTNIKLATKSSKSNGTF